MLHFSTLFIFGVQTVNKTDVWAPLATFYSPNTWPKNLFLRIERVWHVMCVEPNHWLRGKLLIGPTDKGTFHEDIFENSSDDNSTNDLHVQPFGLSFCSTWSKPSAYKSKLDRSGKRTGYHRSKCHRASHTNWSYQRLTILDFQVSDGANVHKSGHITIRPDMVRAVAGRSARWLW